MKSLNSTPFDRHRECPLSYLSNFWWKRFGEKYMLTVVTHHRTALYHAAVSPHPGRTTSAAASDSNIVCNFGCTSFILRLLFDFTSWNYFVISYEYLLLNRI